MTAITNAASAAVAVAVLLVAAAPTARSSEPAPAARLQAAGPAIAIVPRPVQVTARPGAFRLTARTVIWTDRASAPIGRALAHYLEPATGFALRVAGGAAAPAGSISLSRDPSLKRLGAEGYVLDVRRSGIVVRAPEAAGLFYGVQTIRQLLPPDIFREAPVSGVVWEAPAVRIEDAPRFGWRGAHLDTGRHFMPKEFVKKCIDLLALHKLNTFHWHLTEDQGWRLEIAQYPKLTTVGAWRKETLVGRPGRDSAQRQFDKTPHGGFYSQDDAREIVAYAKARFVTVVPEIEMPGHAMAAIAAYPEIGVTGDPVDVATTWGVFSDILNAEPSTVQFMQNVLGEVLQIFPGRYVHIGGDEADKAKWKVNPRIQERIKALGVKDEHELQSWFIRQMDAYLVAHGRRLVGWDEILEGGLAENAVVMSRARRAASKRARRPRHTSPMTPTSHTYLDYYQAKDRDPRDDRDRRVPAARDGLRLETDSRRSGAGVREASSARRCSVTEYMLTRRRSNMAFPRLTAPPRWCGRRRTGKDSRRLRRLQMLDVNFAR